MAELLTDDEIAERASAGSTAGRREGDTITKTFDHGDFVGSVEFVRRLTGPAEEMSHHPDLAISWSEVTVSITNHSAGGLTAADFELAGADRRARLTPCRRPDRLDADRPRRRHAAELRQDGAGDRGTAASASAPGHR